MMAANFGPLPVEEGIARCRRFHDEAVDDLFIRGNACVEHGGARGDARRLPARAGARQRRAWRRSPSLGFTLRAAISSQEAFYVEMLAGDLDAAERIARDAYATLERMGERGYLSSAAALLAHALSRARRARRGRALQPDERGRRGRRRRLLPGALAQRPGEDPRPAGELEEAEALAREAVRWPSAPTC